MSSTCQACLNKSKKRTTKAVADIVSETVIATDTDDTTVDGFLNRNADAKQDVIHQARSQPLVRPSNIPLPPSSSFSTQSSLASSSSSFLSSALSDQLTVTDKFLEMAEGKAVLPPQFRGKPGDNGEDWFRHFEHYSLRKSWLSLNF